ncbi:MAG: hypothetical protein NT062_26395 [Proteobacteria bacterium]|nr:hypothetical protein [Pseudomonadota bacterium]
MSERRTQVGIGVVDGEQPAAPTAEPPPATMATAANIPMLIDAPETSQHVETLSRGFLVVSLKRAFRLQIKDKEVLESERITLEASTAHVTDKGHQAFLAWRRSVLLLVAIMFVPLTVFRFIEVFDGPTIPTAGRVFVMFPAFAELAFCLVMFAQLKNWANWRRQRRFLFVAWALYFLAPFVVYIYPFRDAFDSWVSAKNAAMLGDLQFGFTRAKMHMVVGLVFGVQALLALGPKVISLMPGLIRASVVTKLLFPGTTAPGWLMMLAAPFYALFAYIIVLLPYQVTGSWQFVVGNLGIIVAQIFIAISGRRLTVPLTADESARRIAKTWMAYILIMVTGAVFMVYGLYDFITQLNLGFVRVVTGVLSLISNILLDTLIGTDAIIAAMAYFRQRGAPDPAHAVLLREAETKLDTFAA